MTQSAASQTVQNIEEYLSVQLIDRSKRPFVLTDEGQRIFDGLSSVLRQFDSLVNEIRQSGDEVNGHVTIASIYSVGLSYLPAIEEAFAAKFPGALIPFSLLIRMKCIGWLSKGRSTSG